MRLPDWKARLDALVVQALRHPFAWGTRDCCLWMADATLAVTGVDHAAGVRGSYRTQREAMRVLQSMGGLRGVGDRLGVPIRPLLAGAGDVGIVRAAGAPRGAVCTGPHWLIVHEGGALPMPLDAALMAWRT